ncbi:S9 family peptidase [bacterium]|nr:S9 family peptidase [bacterium]
MTSTLARIIIVLIILLAGCVPQGVSPGQVAVHSQQQTESFSDILGHTDLIPRDVFFGNPDKQCPRLSPDGEQLAYLAAVDGVMNVWVSSLGNPRNARAVTRDTNRGIAGLFWAATNTHLLYVQDLSGNDNWRVFSLDLNTGKSLDLTPMDGVCALIECISDRHPEDIIVGLNLRDPMIHDLYRINISTGSRTLIFKNPGFLDVKVNHDYRICLATRYNEAGGIDVLCPSESDTWILLFDIEYDDIRTTRHIGFNADGSIMYFIDSRNRNTSALFAINMVTRSITLIAEDPLGDVQQFLKHPVNQTIQAASFEYEREYWHVVDNAIADDIEFLQSVVDGEFTVVDRTLDDKYWLVAYYRDQSATEYVLYNRETAQVKWRFSHQTELDDMPLVKMHPVVISSRDNLNLVSYLSLPPGSDPDEDGRPNCPLPMVLKVHGGPNDRDSWGFNSEHQWLTNRGYAVLSVNFRGSTGFGKAFINASDRQWGGKMQLDLVDAVQWAIQESIADPARIAVYGVSYGGFAALTAATQTPDMFAAVIDVMGPSNLVTFMQSLPQNWKPLLETMRRRIGDHTTPEGISFLKSRSPVNHVHRITAPILIVQGARDTRVPRTESDQMVQMLEAKDIPVTYMLYPDEGHILGKPVNRIAFYAIAEQFLARHLGGRSQPIGNDLNKSSAIFPVGLDHVPGAAEALNQMQKNIITGEVAKESTTYENL